MIVLDPDLEPDPVSDPHPATSRGSRSAGRIAAASPGRVDDRKPRGLDSARPDGLDRLPSARSLGTFARKAQEAVRLRGQVTVLLTTDPGIRRLNRRFRSKNKPTDVLSFPAAPALAREIAGDLAISVPTARRQAREQGHSLAIELKVLILHGLLHLAGYDHETDRGQMARRERMLRSRLRLPQGLIERADAVNPAPGAPNNVRLAAHRRSAARRELA